jgi:hypothetical protein
MILRHPRALDRRNDTPINGGYPLLKGKGEIVRAPSHDPSGGVADSLDEAKAAFRAAWLVAVKDNFLANESKKNL